MEVLIFILLGIAGFIGFIWFLIWAFTGGAKVKRKFKKIKREKNFNPEKEYINAGHGIAVDSNQRKIFIGTSGWFGLAGNIELYDMDDVDEWRVSWKTKTDKSGSKTKWFLEFDVNDPNCSWYKIGFGTNESACKGWSSYLKSV